MKTSKPGTGKRWQDVDALLRRWLGERQQLLSLLCALGSNARQSPPSASTQARIERFCEILVDYVSAGHFEVYCELLDEGARAGTKQSREADVLYGMILPTTAVALDFNDRYLSSANRRNFAADLSALGQVLASRFDWEDALIRLLHLETRAVA